MADHLTALDETLTRLALGDEPMVLAGHSTGAMLALEWAAARPERFRGVVLLSLPAYRSPEEAQRCIASLSPLAWATVTKPHWGEVMCGVMWAWRPFWRRVVPLMTPNVPADIARDYVLHNWNSYSSTLWNVLIGHRAEPAAATLAVAGVPVALLHGDRDTIAPVDAVRELAGRHSWPLHVVAGAQHHLPARQPGACAAILERLSAVRPGARSLRYS